jgi:hypothetical protein
MKRIISFFTLFIFIIIGFFYNSMMSFAIKNNIQSNHKWNMKMHCMWNIKYGKWWKHTCPLLKKIDFFSISLNTNYSSKILKIKVLSFINIFSDNKYLLENKNLIKNTSPPNEEEKQKYYSYIDLIKIIKSNT